MLATVRGQRIPLTEDIDCTPQYPPSNTFILFTLIFSFIKIIISFFRIVLKMKREEGKKEKEISKERQNNWTCGFDTHHGIYTNFGTLCILLLSIDMC